MTIEKQAERGISELVGCLTDPIIVYPGGWEETLPEWMKTAITLERLEINMKALKREKITGTDAEVCAYLYTVSLTQPMDNDLTQIYIYIATNTYRRWGKKQIPDDIAVDSISDYQTAELNRLKEWLYRKRTQVRDDGERTEKQQKRGEEIARRKVEQPALFQF